MIRVVPGPSLLFFFVSLSLVPSFFLSVSLLDFWEPDVTNWRIFIAE
jgi:hypothetical protein